MGCWFRHEWFVPRARARECRRCGRYQEWFDYDGCWIDERHPESRTVWTIHGPTEVR